MGVETFAIAERLGISSREAARTIAQAKERRIALPSKDQK
jgi:DNA-binding transcriptional regulator LsrR (DeoR family)